MTSTWVPRGSPEVLTRFKRREEPPSYPLMGHGKILEEHMRCDISRWLLLDTAVHHCTFFRLARQVGDAARDGRL